jgi:hypothetical protein
MRWRTKVLPIAVLAVLIAVNAVLLFLLFRPDRVLTAQPGDQDSVDGGSPTATLSPATTSSPSASGHLTTSVNPSASTDATPSTRPVKPAPVERLLIATSSKTAWRATVGDCDTPGEIERTTNGGARWKRIVRTSPAPIVQLGAEPSGNVFAIGGTRQSCSYRYVSYTNDGTVTASTTRPVDVWFPTPKDRDEINGPGDTKATPCNGHVVGLAPLDLSQALVVCDSGAVMSTHTSGRTWRHVGRIPNTLAIAAESGRYWVAGAHEGCGGVTVQPLAEESGNLTRGVAHCAPGLDVASGQVAMDVTRGTIWLWSGNRVAVSVDDGQTWK